MYFIDGYRCRRITRNSYFLLKDANKKVNLMPALQLPLATCDNFVVRLFKHMCYVYNYRAILHELLGDPYEGCAEIAYTSCNFSGVIAQSPQDFYGLFFLQQVRLLHDQSAVSCVGIVQCWYDMYTGL